MNDNLMTIGGKAVEGAGTFGVVNPATGLICARAPLSTPEILDAAFASAQAAQREWARDEQLRRSSMRDAARVLDAAVTELAPVLTAEQGKPVAAAELELRRAAQWFSYYADLEWPEEVIQDDAAAYVSVRRRPIGVVAAITPWNFPVSLGAWKIAPALLAGNTVVLKPSPYTPITTLRIGQLLAGILPPGVLNVVSGGDDLGRWMTSHPVPRKVSFTGSVATGKHVAASAAPDLKRVTLELGGNDAAIVLDDADPAEIAAKVFWGAFANNGQVCSAIKRLYVPESLHDDIVEALAEVARTVRVGDGAVAGTQLGPLNNKPQFERVIGLVDDAVRNGAVAVTGGHAVAGPGYFYEPTIMTGLAEGVRLVDEEQFGPALPVMTYTDLDDVVDRANNTEFGLSGSVWGTDVDRAADVAARLECGTAWINTHLVLQPHQPFGGAKWSGIGVENGPWGLYGFTELQVLYRSRN